MLLNITLLIILLHALFQLKDRTTDFWFISNFLKRLTDLNLFCFQFDERISRCLFRIRIFFQLCPIGVSIFSKTRYAHFFIPWGFSILKSKNYQLNVKFFAYRRKRIKDTAPLSSTRVGRTLINTLNESTWSCHFLFLSTISWKFHRCPS